MGGEERRERMMLVVGGGKHIRCLKIRDPVFYAMDKISLSGGWRIGRILVPNRKPYWFSLFSSVLFCEGDDGGGSVARLLGLK